MAPAIQGRECQCGQLCIRISCHCMYVYYCTLDLRTVQLRADRLRVLIFSAGRQEGRFTIQFSKKKMPDRYKFPERRKLDCMTVSSFIVTPSEKRRRRRWRAAAYNAKIRRILNNLPVFPKKNCTSKTKKFPVRFFAGTVFFWEHREII